MQTASFTCFGTAIGLADDLKNGLVERFRSLPMSRSAVLLGRLGADTVHSLFSVLLMIAVGYAVGFRIHTNFFAAVLLVGVATAFGVAICTVAAFIGLTIRDPETVQSAGLDLAVPADVRERGVRTRLRRCRAGCRRSRRSIRSR